MKLRKDSRLIGQHATWHGYDRQDYPAIIVNVRHGWITLEYPVNYGGIERLVTARTDTWARLTIAPVDHTT